MQDLRPLYYIYLYWSTMKIYYRSYLIPNTYTVAQLEAITIFSEDFFTVPSWI